MTPRRLRCPFCGGGVLVKRGFLDGVRVSHACKSWGGGKIRVEAGPYRTLGMLERVWAGRGACDQQQNLAKEDAAGTGPADYDADGR